MNMQDIKENIVAIMDHLYELELRIKKLEEKK